MFRMELVCVVVREVLNLEELARLSSLLIKGAPLAIVTAPHNLPCIVSACSFATRLVRRTPNSESAVGVFFGRRWGEPWPGRADAWLIQWALGKSLVSAPRVGMMCSSK